MIESSIHLIKKKMYERSLNPREINNSCVEKHRRITHPLLISLAIRKDFLFNNGRPRLRKTNLAGSVFGIDVAAGVPACRDQDNDLVSLSDSPASPDFFLILFYNLRNHHDHVLMCYNIWIDFKLIFALFFLVFWSK